LESKLTKSEELPEKSTSGFGSILVAEMSETVIGVTLFEEYIFKTSYI
jgi:hypothetical protein